MFDPVGIGSKLVVTTGVPVSLVPIGTKVNRVDIQALNTNVGHVIIGNRNVSNNPANGGIDLAPGDVYNIELVADLINIYLNGSQGDGISFVYWIGDRN